MKKWFSQLDICFKTALITSAVIVLAFLITCFLFWLDLGEIPLGLLLGGGVSAISYLAMGIVNKKEKQGKTWATIVVTAARFLLIAGVIALSGYLYYVLNLHIFNVFAVTGSYLVSVICLCILLGKERKTDVR